MLCAKYDYKTDIAVKQAEAREEGKKEGIAEGQKKKAVEAALLLVHDYNASPEEASEKMNAPLELVLEALKQKK